MPFNEQRLSMIKEKGGGEEGKRFATDLPFDEFATELRPPKPKISARSGDNFKNYEKVSSHYNMPLRDGDRLVLSWHKLHYENDRTDADGDGIDVSGLPEGKTQWTFNWPADWKPGWFDEFWKAIHPDDEGRTSHFHKMKDTGYEDIDAVLLPPNTKFRGRFIKDHDHQRRYEWIKGRDYPQGGDWYENPTNDFKEITQNTPGFSGAEDNWNVFEFKRTEDWLTTLKKCCMNDNPGNECKANNGEKVTKTHPDCPHILEYYCAMIGTDENGASKDPDVCGCFNIPEEAMKQYKENSGDSQLGSYPPECWYIPCKTANVKKNTDVNCPSNICINISKNNTVQDSDVEGSLNQSCNQGTPPAKDPDSGLAPSVFDSDEGVMQGMANSIIPDALTTDSSTKKTYFIIGLVIILLVVIGGGFLATGTFFFLFLGGEYYERDMAHTID